MSTDTPTIKLSRLLDSLANEIALYKKHGIDSDIELTGLRFADCCQEENESES